MQMKLSGEENLRRFSSILHYLKVVDKDIKIEATDNGLVLRALNGPKTAYSAVELSPDFFDFNTYHRDEAAGGRARGENFSCKVPCKYLCAITKNLRTNCNTLTFRAEIHEGSIFELVFEMLSNNQIRRRHRFKYMDCEVLSAAYNETGASRLTSHYRVLSQAFTHLHASPEIILTATETNFKVQSYHAPAERAIDRKDNLDSQVNLDSGNFEYYEFQQDDEELEALRVAQEAGEEVQPEKQFICCVRELRALLHLSESMDIDDVSMYFTKRGQPLKLSVANDVVSITLVMTTIERAPDPPVQASAAAGSSAPAPRSIGASQQSKPGRASSSFSSSSASSSSQGKMRRVASQPTSEDDAVEPPKAGNRKPPGGARPRVKPPPATSTTQEWERGEKAYARDNEGEDEDEDDSGPLGPSHRRTTPATSTGSKVRRIVLGDEDEDEDEGVGQSEGTQSQSQALSNSPSLPASQSDAVAALSDLGRKRLQHRGKISLLDDSEESS